MLIDTHCHLYLPEFKDDLNETINKAIENNVGQIFLPAIDSETHQQLITLCNHTKPNCRLLPMMGLHPCSVKENYEHELKIVGDYLNTDTNFVAIGEIGLDYYWDLTYKEQQIIALKKQIEWSC